MKRLRRRLTCLMAIILLVAFAGMIGTLVYDKKKNNADYGLLCYFCYIASAIQTVF